MSDRDYETGASEARGVVAVIMMGMMVFLVITLAVKRPDWSAFELGMLVVLAGFGVELVTKAVAPARRLIAEPRPKMLAADVELGDPVLEEFAALEHERVVAQVRDRDAEE